LESRISRKSIKGRRKRILRAAGILLFIVLGTFAGGAFAGEVTIRQGQTCISDGCHDRLGKEKYVHPAMEGGECSSCHEQQGKEHAFKFIAEGNKLCLGCHEVGSTKKNQHPAVEMGCINCHNPHQSNNPSLLIAYPVSSVCFTCHDESLTKKKWGHGPAEAGECLMCHDPHESDNDTLLRAAQPDLCFTCHTEEKTALDNGKVVHGAVKRGCAKCHNPHGEDRRFLLQKEIPGLCFGCHEQKGKEIEQATVKHGILEKDKLCLNCHSPHSSENAKLLNVKVEEICFKCHDKEVNTADGTLKDMKKWMETNQYVHPPAADGGCTNCHNVHGSQNYRILSAQYPDGFYAGYSEEAYSLCFGCHDSDMVKYEKTTKLTGFRDGARNLHFLHVNKPVKGRVCTDCHDPHAGGNEKFIKAQVKFGDWQMPIRFQGTETGGSCYPGCHKRQTYDRVNPVLGETPPQQ
jgi:predicted CXXCH cytochrome family protein